MQKLSSNLLFIILFIASCTDNKKQNTIDHPAYHNPTVQALTDSIAAFPQMAEYYFQRSVALSRINQDSLALIDLQHASQLDSLNTEYLNAIGYLQLNLGHNENAATAFEKSLRIKPPDVTTRLDLATAYMACNKPNDAETIINKVLQLAPQYPPALLMQAKLKAAQKDTLSAISLSQKIVQFDPTYYDASMQLADWYNDMGNVAAIKQYQATFSLDSTDAAPLYEIGRFYKKKHDWEKAKSAFVKCFMIDKDYTYAYINLAEILMQQDSLSKARNILQIATDTEPSNSDSWFVTAQCFQQMKNIDSARFYYNQAARLGHDDAEIKGALNSL